MRGRISGTSRVLALLALLSGGAGAANLTVFAASSLTDAFTEIGQAFDTKTGNHTTFSFAGSQALRTQLAQGARADVFASANATQFEPLVQAGLIRSGQPFARNRLTVITPAARPQVQTLADLARPGLKLVIADRTVPVGEATRRALDLITASGTYGKDFTNRVLKNVVSEEPNVRQVALKVQLGQADAAVVYTSDVTPALKKSVRTVGLPTRFNPLVTYPIGVLQASANPEAAQAFVQFVRSPEGQRILRKWGFLSAP
ncbi:MULTISPECIES: molybdate ABC transporter substrate-binding protein [Deinococcus]|uniref:ABC-type molybdate transport system, periplasmic component n=1 Tax=Deinococcus geothermalis (strain DSM 11300 / CIP 105573 / AG-3a) TaxID=319795 RepID=Q1J3K1_DEIGD|nr:MULTISPECIES: molybdate ABC transporter substrate-binding protein [Deinococcus]ABF43933.1 ABC-type molybdate transport system, periplasmic component [Deinococcus geothermalis DSM 11300]